MAEAYSTSATIRAIVIATAIAGTLDILGAFAFAVIAGGSPAGVLRGICGAIVDPDGFGSPLIPLAIGLALHFAIMTVMASFYLSAAAHVAWLNRVPVVSGAGYGLALWLVMCWFVLPQRWPTMFPTGDSADIAMQVGCHVLLVGIPIAFVARSAARWRFDFPDNSASDPQ